MSKNTILIVDDTPENLDVLRGLLENNYNLKVALNGQTAIKIANIVPLPDLILLDIMMPEMDGFETCQHLKENPKTRNIPVIFLTSKTETEDIIKGFEIGAIDYVTKPFNPLELIARVKTQMTIKHQWDIIAKNAAEQKEMLHILCHDLANHFAILSMAVQMYDVMPESIDTLIQNMKIAIENGIDVIDLVREMRAIEEKKDILLTPINLLQNINESQLLLYNKIENKKIIINVDVNEDINITAEKRSFINSVFNNILTNAIKFSFEGGTIDIKASLSDGNVTLSIKDYGIGIPQTLIKEIFNIKKSISRRGTNGEKGTGFGMPLMKKFINLYGGAIEINSQAKEEYPEDHWTEFVITLKSA